MGVDNIGNPTQPCIRSLLVRHVLLNQDPLHCWSTDEKANASENCKNTGAAQSWHRPSAGPNYKQKQQMLDKLHDHMVAQFPFQNMLSSFQMTMSNQENSDPTSRHNLSRMENGSVALPPATNASFTEDSSLITNLYEIAFQI